MNNIWFTSDTHFGHANMLKFEPYARPFATVEEMNDALVDNWNSIVKPEDTVWHLGDFCFGSRNISIAGRLHGKKRLVLGNHDRYPCALYLQFFDQLFGTIYWEQCVLSHMPIHPRQLGKRQIVNVHGHLHSNIVTDEHYFNVSVEQNNLKPFHADEIRDRCKRVRCE